MFARTDQFSDPAHAVMRLDPATGAVVWTSEPDPGGLQWSDFVGSTDDTLLLVPTRDDDLVSYDRADGTHLWTRPGSMAGSAAVGGGRVAVVDEDCELVVLDERSGDEVESFDDGDCWSAPAIVDGSLVYVGWGDDGYELLVVPLP